MPYYLPDFHAAIRKAVADAKDSNVDLSSPKTPRQKPPKLTLHHDTLVAGYDGDEYTLLGMAVKYAGLHGVCIEFIGRNIFAKESHVANLQANVLHYLPEIFAIVRKLVADGKLIRFWGWGILSAWD